MRLLVEWWVVEWWVVDPASLGYAVTRWWSIGEMEWRCSIGPFLSCIVSNEAWEADELRRRKVGEDRAKRYLIADEVAVAHPAKREIRSDPCLDDSQHGCFQGLDA